jgi:hypothetical protein
MVDKIISIDKDVATGASHTQPTGVFQGSNLTSTDDVDVKATPLVLLRVDIDTCTRSSSRTREVMHSTLPKMPSYTCT